MSENVIRITADGPLDFRGRIEIENEDGGVAFSDTRAEICRCGGSGNKPLCDGSHATISFCDAGLAAAAEDGDLAAGGELMKISPRMNGPLHLEGRMRIENVRGEVIFRGDDAWLCRCGGSQNKPFCDGTHKRIGFRTSGREGFPPSRKTA